MHELSIALSILDVAAEEAKRHGDVQVTAIHLRLGPLAGVVPDALRSAFELAREDSSWPMAELRIEDVPVIVRCPNCRVDRGIASIQDIRCPDCGTSAPEVIRGRELEMVGLEIE
jgi:hydrogenase nickel incorporation protein HypA/HybF